MMHKLHICLIIIVICCQFCHAIDLLLQQYHFVNRTEYRVVKTAHSPTVYLIYRNQSRHYVPDFETFKSHGFAIRDIQGLSTEDIEKFPVGNDVPSVIPYKPTNKCPCINSAQARETPESLKRASTKESPIDHLAEYKKVQQSRWYNTTTQQKRSNICLLQTPQATQFISDYGLNQIHYTIEQEEIRIPIILLSSHYNLSTYYPYFHSTLMNYTETQHVHDEHIPFDLQSCMIIIEIVEEAKEAKYLCPEQCQPIPHLLLPYNTLQYAVSFLTSYLHTLHKYNTSNKKKASFRASDIPSILTTIPTFPLTCSLTWRTLLHAPVFTSYFQHLSAVSTASSSALSASSTLKAQLLSFFLHHLITRRLEECFETLLWNSHIPHHLHTSYSPSAFISASNHVPSLPWLVPPRRNAIQQKRHVFGMIIWVGSRSRYALLEDQIRILSTQYASKDPHSVSLSVDYFQRLQRDGHREGKENDVYRTDNMEDVITGWIASEDSYSCHENTACPRQSNRYYRHMPSSWMKHTTIGWACAQRRPVRSLAHILMLYHSKYILLGDDDTYVSLQILQSTAFRNFIHSQFIFSNIVYGTTGGGGRMTSKGFFFGGGGYLFSEKIIEDFNGYTLFGPKEHSTQISSLQQMNDLAMIYPMAILTKQYCSPEHLCMQIISSNASSSSAAADTTTVVQDLFTSKKPKESEVMSNKSSLVEVWSGGIGYDGRLSVRLIDLCNNYMSDEFTCYHSDHALSRCFSYGLFAEPVNVACNGQDISQPSQLHFGMCFDTHTCSKEKHLTCHRWKANPMDITEPILTGLKVVH